MLQNKLFFNQSSVSLEIVGLPDYSNNENTDQISIISQWKLMIINKPLIEGNVDHLLSIMEAFYSYSNFLINNEAAIYESKLIDIKAENFITHDILLKSSKPNIKPLNIKIGNSILVDIINCFDQFNSSNKLKNFNANNSNIFLNKRKFKFINKAEIANYLIPPLLSLFSLFLVSSTFIYFYNPENENNNNSSNYSKKILIASDL